MGNACFGCSEALCCKDSHFGTFWQMVCLRGVAAVYWLVVVRWDCVC